VADRKLIGRETPRLWTRPLRTLTRRTSLGFECIDFALHVLGIDLLPWQKWLLIHVLELDANGNFRFRQVLILVARQSGKTTLLKILALWMMYSGRVLLVLGSAQSLDIARESWQGAVDIAQEIPELAAEVLDVRRTNGEQEFKLTNKARYKIAATTRKAGRSLSVDLLILDELREHRDWLAWGALSKTTMARPNALTMAISNAGDDMSVVLNKLRETALAERDSTIGLFEWSGPDGCDLDDFDAWEQANPGLGYTITEAAIRSALATDPPAVFRTEVLCQRVETMETALDVAGWRDCADAGATLKPFAKRISVCLDVSLDGHHVTLVGAAVDDHDRVRAQVLGAWPSLEAARDEVRAIVRAVKPRSAAWFKGSPASAFATELRELGFTEITAGAAVEASMELASLVQARALIQPDDPLLNTQAAGVSKVLSGDGWRFTRKGAGHCDAVYALAGAVYLARNQPPAPPKAMVV
jgi:hypothetical protein